jgi:hypothetical protein
MSLTAILIEPPRRCLTPPKGLGVRAPKREKVHMATKWDPGNLNLVLLAR